MLQNKIFSDESLVSDLVNGGTPDVWPYEGPSANNHITPIAKWTSENKPKLHELFIDKIFRTVIFFLPEEVPMHFSTELKIEMKKALKFSGFITFIVMGLMLAQFCEHWWKSQPKRGLASLFSDSSTCAGEVSDLSKKSALTVVSSSDTMNAPTDTGSCLSK